MDYKVLYEKTSPGKLFGIVAIPGVISMLVSALYQIIDGAIVGRVLGATAFAAVNLVMPLVIINFAIADLVGVGSSVPIAIKLGEKDEKAASNIFSSACLLIVVLGAALGTPIFIFADNLVRIMGANEEIVAMSALYLRIYALCSPFTTIMFAMDNYLRICGKVRYSMVLNILLSVFSAGLELLFLLVFHMGIEGASLSTCIGMVICVLLALVPFLRGKLQLQFTKPRLNRTMLKSIFTNGAPGFLNNISGQVTSLIINVVLLRLGGAIAVSVYGVLMYADGFILPILYGLCDSLQPAVGYNYGAKNYSRIWAIERRCFSICGVLSVLMTIVMFLFKEPIVGIFIKAEDTAVIDMAVHALSLFAFSYLTRWISLAIQSYLSAIGKASYATVISISMAFVFPLLFLAVLSPFGLDGLWLNMPLRCAMAAILSVILFAMHYKRWKRETSASQQVAS
ncbi:MAG: MATE family efflux transporter [Oscillospiraceae bacterium]